MCVNLVKEKKETAASYCRPAGVVRGDFPPLDLDISNAIGYLLRRTAYRSSRFPVTVRLLPQSDPVARQVSMIAKAKAMKEHNDCRPQAHRFDEINSVNVKILFGSQLRHCDKLSLFLSLENTRNRIVARSNDAVTSEKIKKKSPN